jgi:L-threonylcarbamoyladenylate synthase
MGAIHPWQPNESCNLVIRHLVEGRCVALPTESTYEIVASALHPEAVAGLGRFASALAQPAIVLGDFANLRDWLPLLSGAPARIYHKMGPGPITLLAEGGFAYGNISSLPEGSRQLLVQDGRLAVRWPAHAIWNELRRANLPLVSVPVQVGVNAEATADAVGEYVACILDAGPTQHGKPPSVVHAEGRRIRMVHEGGLASEQLEQLALCRILFLCTGNTCRSPMAEVLCAKLLADQLGCAPSDLRCHGYCVESAGLSAAAGSEASPDAVRLVADFGADLSAHRSRMASLEMLMWADHIFAMTAGHAYLLSPLTEIPTPRLLSPRGDDVADPIGGELADYRACAEQIIQCLRERLPELLES